MERLIVWDEFDQSHYIEDGDPLFNELKTAYNALSTTQNVTSNGYTPRVVWPLTKIVQNRGFGWWSVYKRLGDFEKELEQLVPNPGHFRLLKLDGEYNPTELSDMLQHYGSYLATLHHMEAMIEAQVLALKETFKTGMQIAMASSDSEAKTVAVREGETLSNNELLKENKRMQIQQEACLILIRGWREAYDMAWHTVSRIISLRTGELSLQTGRHA